LRRILVPLLVGVLIALLIGVLIRHSTLPPLGFVEIARDSAAYKLWPLTTDLLIVLIQLTTTETSTRIAGAETRRCRGWYAGRPSSGVKVNPCELTHVSRRLLPYARFLGP
jgi:hypothetical protein